MSQSVFLNLNTNFSNDTASNYTQYFDNPLEIPANAEVALYNAELKKHLLIYLATNQYNYL